jgi:hypothetical protein
MVILGMTVVSSLAHAALSYTDDELKAPIDVLLSLK